MATKTKTAPVAPSEGTLEARLTAALESFHGGKADAEAALTAVLEEALAGGEAHVALVRRIRMNLAALAERKATRTEETVDILAAATAALNRKQPQEAQALLEKAEAEVKTRPAFHYLCAQVQAVEGNLDAAAGCLSKALAGNPDLLYTYMLEPDFEAARRHPAFVALEQA